MATTPVFVNAPGGLSGLVLKLAAEPVVGTLDPALVNGAGGDALVELTNIAGWYKADVTEALVGVHAGTVETSGGDGIAAGEWDMADTTTPVFESLYQNTKIAAIITAIITNAVGADVSADIATAQADLDTITGTAGVLLATGQTATPWSSLEASASTMKEGTAKAGTLTTISMPTTLTEADDVFNGRILLFKRDTTTVALRLQATDITDFANTNGVLTFDAVTTAPSATETFVIL